MFVIVVRVKMRRGRCADGTFEETCVRDCRKAGRQKGDRKYLRKHSMHRNELRFRGGKVCRGRVASGMIRGKYATVQDSRGYIPISEDSATNLW